MCISDSLRTLTNGTEGVARSISTGDDMTAGEKNDRYSLGSGRNFITYKKSGFDDGKYHCLKTTKDQRLLRVPITTEGTDPCFYGTQGPVVVHRVVDEAGIGKISSIVVDTVTFNDGMQDSIVSYDFDPDTAGHDQNSANYHQATVWPGGRDGGHGRIEHTMYNGVESGVGLICESIDLRGETTITGDCPANNSDGQVHSRDYTNQLRGKTYQQDVFEDGQDQAQATTQTWHKIQIIKRASLPDTFRVLTVRTDHTKDDVTTAATYEYN